MNVVESPYAVKSIIGSIKTMHTNVTEQDMFVEAFTSTIEIDHVNIDNVSFTQSVIKLSLSSLNGSNIMVNNVRNPSNSQNSFISCQIDSSIDINNMSYSQAQTSMLLLNNVTGQIQNVETMSTSSVSDMIQADD